MFTMKGMGLKCRKVLTSHKDAVYRNAPVKGEVHEKREHRLEWQTGKIGAPTPMTLIQHFIMTTRYTKCQTLWW